MNKEVFYKLDNLLPRWVAIFPYQVAILVIRIFFKLAFGMSTKVWGRNSTRSGTFIFGISDLDISIVGNNRMSRELIREALKVFKRIFPFLGEAHFYTFPQVSRIISRMNALELQRDPLFKDFMKVETEVNDIERFVFLQRMFFSDAISLTINPVFRQQKWMHHFSLIGMSPPPGMITASSVKNILLKLSGDNPEIRASLEKWYLHVQEPGFDVYRADLGPYFKVIAPHMHLWFLNDDENTDTEFLKNLQSPFRDIIKRQIDWEIWGLYCQRFWMNQDQVLEHLSRLVAALCVLDPSLQKENSMAELNFLFSDYFRPVLQNS